MSLLVWRNRRPGPSGFGPASTAEEVTEGLRLDGKVVAITGCSSGLGLESARVLHQRGAQIVGLARSEAKAREAGSAIGDAVPVACELTAPSSIRAAAATIARRCPPLDVLLCNAGIMALPTRELVHGIEKQFFTNHLGHFLLVQALREHLAPAARVVVVSSGGHAWAPPEGIRFDDLAFDRDYDPKQAYGQAKLANVLFARGLARRLTASQTANAVHPGGIATNLGRHLRLRGRAILQLLRPIALKSVAQGAATQCYVAVHPDVAATTGGYFADCNVATPRAHGRDDAMAERLWEESEAIAARL